MTAAVASTTPTDMMARITAQRLVKHLERSGFVPVRRPPARAPSATGGDGPA